MDYQNGSNLQAFNGTGSGGQPIDIHEPFTTAERMEQLGKIDEVSPNLSYVLYPNQTLT